jgi:hypothetical protein
MKLMMINEIIHLLIKMMRYYYQTYKDILTKEIIPLIDLKNKNFEK